MGDEIVPVEHVDERRAVRCSVCGDSENAIVGDGGGVCSLCYWVSRRVVDDEFAIEVPDGC